jgi:hypothetical protein
MFPAPGFLEARGGNSIGNFDVGIVIGAAVGSGFVMLLFGMLIGILIGFRTLGHYMGRKVGDSKKVTAAVEETETKMTTEAMASKKAETVVTLNTAVIEEPETQQTQPQEDERRGQRSHTLNVVAQLRGQIPAQENEWRGPRDFSFQNPTYADCLQMSSSSATHTSHSQ